MKNLLSILFILPFLSCSIDSEEYIDPELLGDWMLLYTCGQVPNSTQTGADLPFHEVYSLNSNGTFTKTRTKDRVVMTISGTYEVIAGSGEISGDDILFNVYFHHRVNSLLLATCYSNSLTEHLFLTTGGRLISTYNACDGPGLEYEKATVFPAN